jgi:hypothetical protein
VKRLAALFSCALCLAERAGAQHGRAGDQEAARFLPLLAERNRETMHPGEPLKIVGLEQGENEIRSLTPALAHGDEAVALVDREDSHRRALSMYDERATFHQPPASFEEANSSRLTRSRRAAPADETGAGALLPPVLSWPLLVASALLLALEARTRLRLLIHRRRRAAG